MRTLYFHPRMQVLEDACIAMNVSNLLRELIVHTCEVGSLKEQGVEHRALMQLLVTQLKRMPKEPLSIRMPRDRRALAAANQILDSPDSELSAVADQVQTSLRTLQRIFAEETGLSFGKWRRNARLFSALPLLEQGYSVTDVAMDLGFESLSAFISSFKTFFGVTPAKYFPNRRTVDARIHS